MAGAILDGPRGPVRLHAGNLHSLLILLDAESWLPDGARTVVRRWLADIDADLGYVELSGAALEAPGARDGLREALRDAAMDLEAPGGALPRTAFDRVEDPDALRRAMLTEARELLEAIGP